MAARRKYSVEEIDRMRAAIAAGRVHGYHINADARDRLIEDRLRTYMLNGTEPKELEDEAERWLKELRDIEALHRQIERDVMQGATRGVHDASAWTGRR